MATFASASRRDREPRSPALAPSAGSSPQALERDVEEGRPGADDVDGHANLPASAGCSAEVGATGSRSATATEGTSGCSASALQGRSPRAAQGRVDGRPLGRPHRPIRPACLDRHRADRDRHHPGPADHARHLDHGLLVQERHARAVRGVQDHHLRSLTEDRLDDLRAPRPRSRRTRAPPRPRASRRRGRPGLRDVRRLALGDVGPPRGQRRRRARRRPRRTRRWRSRNCRAARRPERIASTAVVRRSSSSRGTRSASSPAAAATRRRTAGPPRTASRSSSASSPGSRSRSRCVHAAQPAQVVDAEVVEPQLVGRRGRARRRPGGTGRRRVADADHAIAEHAAGSPRRRGRPGW